MNSTSDAFVQPDCAAISLRIQNGDRPAEQELYDTVIKGLRLLVGRALRYGPELEDTVQDVMWIAISNIRAGKLQDHRCVIGYIRTIMKCRISNVIANRVQARKRSDALTNDVVPDRRRNPEQEAQNAELRTLLQAALGSLSDQQREILSRFYVEDQSAQQICKAMSLNETQFRLLKSRSKAKFGEIGRRYLKHARVFKSQVMRQAGAAA